MKKSDIQNRYIETIGVVVIVLALVRCAFPNIATQQQETVAENVLEVSDTVQTTQPLTEQTDVQQKDAPTMNREVPEVVPQRIRKEWPRWNDKPHRIYSVSNYKTVFPDSNATQLVAAQRWGVLPVKNRKDAEMRMSELVYVGASPYYHVDPLTQSIPYLVPRAAILLEDIGKAFFDSLQIKGVPLHRFIVTSVLRTEADVTKLRRFNKNATENSCHLYGTTFDICYNRYETVEDPEGPRRRSVRDDSLKFVLSEVLRDMRENGRCYVKYEVKQGCFHMTVR